MRRHFWKWACLGGGILIAAVIVVAHFSKPTIKHRALGGPVRIVEVDESLLKRGFLGIDYALAPKDQLASVGLENGVLVTRVVEGGPAESAGIAVGDILTRVNEQPIKHPSDLRGESLFWAPEQVVKLTFVHRDDAGTVEEVADARLISFDEIRQLTPRDE